MSCYKASGKIYLRKKTVANQPFQFLGNAQAVLNTEIEETAVPDYTNAAGGNACADKILSKCTLDLTIYDFKKDNLAKAVQGGVSTGSVVAIVDEEQNAFLGEFIPTNNLIDLTVAPVVQDAATGLITYVVDDDYTVEQGGIRVVPGGDIATAIAAGGGDPKFFPLFISYTPMARDVIEALTKAGDSYEVLIITQNRADAGKFGRWDIYAVDFSPTASLNIITREFGNLVLSGEALADASRGDGVSESAYFQIQTQS